MYVAGLPLRWFFPKQWRYIKSMEAQLEEVQGPLPKLLSDYYTMLEKERIPLEVRGQFVAGLFWAAQANTIVMAFYAIYYLLKEPNAAVAIQEEIDRVLLKHGCTPETLNYLALNDLTLLDAFLDEVMRYKTASMPIREVLERPRIELKSGRILEPEVGEQVAIYTRCVHYNPDIFDNPHGFQWDRFVGKQGANAFSYQGKPLRYPLLAFGGGASICPGRHFAKNEFKLAAAMLFANLDMNLLSDTLPEEDQSRRGFGAAMPVADIEFSFRRKKHLSDAYSHSSPDVVTSIG